MSKEPQPDSGRATRVNATSETEVPVLARRRGRPLALALLVFVVAVAAAGVLAGFLLSAPSATPTAVEFEVLPGWGGRQVAVSLHDDGLIRSELAFTSYLRLRDLDHSIGEGLYDLTRAMSAPQIAAALAAGGRPRVVDIVVPEGWRAANIVSRLASNGVADERSLAELIRRPGADLAPDSLPPGRGLEGYLYPATYEVPLHATAAEALALMVQRFDDELHEIGGADLSPLLEEHGLSVHSWVTLASMVQAEAANEGEMGIIAGVFVNRLELGMPLQSDPTVAYGLGKSLPELSATAGDLSIETPWNTYTLPGMPFGPIGSPGSDALRAVLEPERYAADGALYLFFLHGTDAGEPVFRPNTNLPAHNRDVQAYLRND